MQASFPLLPTGILGPIRIDVLLSSPLALSLLQVVHVFIQVLLSHAPYLGCFNHAAPFMCH